MKGGNEPCQREIWRVASHRLTALNRQVLHELAGVVRYKTYGCKTSQQTVGNAIGETASLATSLAHLGMDLHKSRK